MGIGKIKSYELKLGRAIRNCGTLCGVLREVLQPHACFPLISILRDLYGRQFVVLEHERDLVWITHHPVFREFADLEFEPVALQPFGKLCPAGFRRQRSEHFGNSRPGSKTVVFIEIDAEQNELTTVKKELKPTVCVRENPGSPTTFARVVSLPKPRHEFADAGMIGQIAHQSRSDIFALDHEPRIQIVSH